MQEMAKTMQNWDVIVIGAGAAGLMCAIEAGKRGRRVLVLDHARKLCEKIRISGGGRCNFTNIHTAPENFLSGNPHFCKSALARYRPRDFLDLVEKHSIPWHEKTLGQLFCDHSAQDIITMLLAECESAGAEVRYPVRVLAVRPKPERVNAPRFEVESSDGLMTCHSLVVATGGLSIPKIGATDFGHVLAQQLGIPVTPLRPALVPLLLNAEDKAFCKSLSGVSQDCVASAKREGRKGAKIQSFRENLLFTHRGLSGPAILQISSYWQPGRAITLDLLPDHDLEALLLDPGEGKKLLANALAPLMTKRFAGLWVERFAENKPLAQLGAKKLKAVAEGLRRWQVTPVGDEGYAKAEVTLGGVDTQALSSATLESKAVPGLHFLGEVVDVTGHLGGYNFQWAWASGHAAGQVV